MEATPARQGHLYTVIGRTYDDLGRSAEADSLLRLAVARLDDDPIRWSRAATALGAVLAKGDSADFAEAEALFRRVLAVRQARLAPTDTDLADAYADLGFVLWRQGAFEPAVEAAEHAVSLHRAGVPPDSAGLASALNVLGDALESAQRMDEAEGVFREMLRVRRAWFGPNHPSVPVGLSSFAGFLRNMGRYDEAAPFAREAFEVSRATLGPDHPNTLEHSILVASILRGQGRPDEAVPIIEDVIDRILRTDGPDHPYLAYYYDQHARALMAAERYDEAAAVLALGLAAARSTAGTPSIEGANIVAKQGSVALSLGDAAAAVRLYRAAVDEFGQVFGTSENAFSAGVLNGYGQALLAAGRTRPARAAFRESVAAFDAVYGPGNEQGASVRERLAEVTAL